MCQICLFAGFPGSLAGEECTWNAGAAAAAKSLQSRLTRLTLCDPIDGSPPGSSVPGILQARILEWLPFPSPIHESESEVTQLCLTLGDPMDCSLLGSSVHGIFQEGVLESVAISFSSNAGGPGSIPGLGRSPGEGIGYSLQYSSASLVAQMVKNPPAMLEA